MRNSLQKLLFMIIFIASSATLAAESNYALLINNNTITNGAYKTINYRICTNSDTQPSMACSAINSIDIKDPSATQPKVTAKVTLKTGDFLEIISATEKDNAGREIATGNYLIEGHENDNYSYCEGNAHRINLFDNYKIEDTGAESTVTCQDGIYR